jgi:hypothetical protein
VLRVLEKRHGLGITEEALAIFIVSVLLKLMLARSYAAIGAIFTFLLEGSIGGLGPPGAAKSIVKCGDRT